jgi:hypothetical protein
MKQSEIPDNSETVQATRAAREAAETHAALEKSVRERLGDERLGKLAKQPLAIAAGGIDNIITTACREQAGTAKPTISSAARVLQLCGSKPKPADLAD